MVIYLGSDRLIGSVFFLGIFRKIYGCMSGLFGNQIIPCQINGVCYDMCVTLSVNNQNQTCLYVAYPSICDCFMPFSLYRVSLQHVNLPQKECRNVSLERSCIS